MPLRQTSTSAEIATFLAATHIPDFNLLPRVVEFNSARDKAYKIRKLRSTLANEDLERNVSPSTTIADAVRWMNQDGAIAMVSPDPMDRHPVLFVLRDRGVYIYDPCWASSPVDLGIPLPPPTIRLPQVRHVKVHNLVKAMKRKFAIDRIRIGGDGVGRSTAMRMCGEVLEKFAGGDANVGSLEWAWQEVRL